jgi:hypothetical protein
MDKPIEPAIQWFRQEEEKEACGPDRNTKVVEIGIHSVTVPHTYELVYSYEFFEQRARSKPVFVEKSGSFQSSKKFQVTFDKLFIDYVKYSRLQVQLVDSKQNLLVGTVSVDLSPLLEQGSIPLKSFKIIDP